MENFIFCAVYIAICKTLPNDMFLWHWRPGKKELSLLMILISWTKCQVGKDMLLVNNEGVRIFSKENVSVC